MFGSHVAYGYSCKKIICRGILRQEIGEEGFLCLHYKVVRSLDEELGIWCDYDFQCSFTNFGKAENCQNEQCIFIACCISQKIEGVCYFY